MGWLGVGVRHMAALSFCMCCRLLTAVPAAAPASAPAPADRVFGILRERNPELTGERRRTVLKPPQVRPGGGVMQGLGACTRRGLGVHRAHASSPHQAGREGGGGAGGAMQLHMLLAGRPGWGGIGTRAFGIDVYMQLVLCWLASVSEFHAVQHTQGQCRERS